MALVLVLGGLAILAWSKKNLRVRLANLRLGAVPPSAEDAPNAGARELTAEQLAGSLSRNPADPAAGRNRRNRRPRRTPSQVSTTSLPVYMKEPGEHELVIFR